MYVFRDRMYVRFFGETSLDHLYGCFMFPRAPVAMLCAIDDRNENNIYEYRKYLILVIIKFTYILLI